MQHDADNFVNAPIGTKAESSLGTRYVKTREVSSEYDYCWVEMEGQSYYDSNDMVDLGTKIVEETLQDKVNNFLKTLHRPEDGVKIPPGTSHVSVYKQTGELSYYTDGSRYPKTNGGDYTYYIASPKAITAT